MKIFKKNEHSLLVKPFAVKDTLYLAVTVLIFFDLENPDDPLSEQDLWSTIPGQIESQGVLDMGMAKPRGEVLVTGSCHAPRGTKRTAAQVSMRVGTLEKRLHVFGNRFWTFAGGTVRVISDPEPFYEMPLVYENAFGGHGFDKNPVGKGIAPVVAANGEKRHRLPNIEVPGHLIGSAADRPDPAGFGPLDLLWPQRAKKQGTYDKQWQQERWPHFPEDLDYEFFNTAPEDQFITGFFKGGEPVEIVNMHPDIQSIRSHLPQLRIRCFATKKTSVEAAAQDNEIFEEVPLHIDTVRLFPSILRGVVMYRGTTQILDDEYADVRRIFVATERLAEAPKPLEFYLQAQKKALDRTVPIDQAPLQAAQKKIGEAFKRFKALPKEIHAMRCRAMGKAPHMPAPTPAEMKERADAMIAGHLALVDKLEAQAKGMQAKWGHVAQIPLDKFDAMRAQLRQTGLRVGEAQKKLDAAREKGNALKQAAAEQLRTKVKPADLAKAGIDPDNLLAPKSVNPWHDHGFAFAVQCRKALDQNREAMAFLSGLGFSQRTIRRAWLGVNQEDRHEDRTSWGLAPRADEQGRSVPLVLPQGLVLPRFCEVVLNRILILPENNDPKGEAVLIEGSEESPLFFPAACLIDLPGVAPAGSAPCVRVADELQALLVEQEIGDACSVIVLKEPGEKPDDAAAKAMADASVFLIVLPEAGISEHAWAAWSKAYPNAAQILLPSGKTVFEARSRGTEIRSWIMEALDPDIAEKHQVAPAMPEPGKPPEKSPMTGLTIPSFDIKTMVAGLMQEIRDVHQPKFDAIKKEHQEAENKAREAILKAGKDPDQVLAAAGRQPKMSFSQAGDTLAKQMGEHRDKLKKKGLLTPQIEEKINTQAAEAVRMGRDGDKRLQEGMVKIAEAKSNAANLKAGQIPDDMKAAFEARGIDPDKMRKLTREEVIERHARKESLSGAVLNGLDLSELDLQGIDLRHAQCRQTKFSGTNLSRADLSQIMAQAADFTKACLRGVRSEKGIFIKAVFQNADLTQSGLRMAVLQEADLTEADFSKSNLHMTVLQKASMKKADFSEAVINMSVFTSADASDTIFSGARLTKCLFQKTGLDRADFSGAVLNATMFHAVKGASVTFAGADMSKSRMGGQSVLAGADFTGIRMTQGCFRDSDLSGADFQGAGIEASIIENCDLKGAGLLKVSSVKTRFSKSNLEGVDMRGLNLFLGSLRKARLVNTDLRGANLYGVDFYKAVLGGTRLEDANLKMTLLQGRTEYLP